MRISDWSSDVCSSDLKRVDAAALAAGWRDFAGRVAAQFPRLDAMGIAYRVAPPGARIADGMLEANSVFPGTAIEYRRGGSVWTRYAGPVTVTGTVELRSRSDRKSTRLNSRHSCASSMPSS